MEQPIELHRLVIALLSMNELSRGGRLRKDNVIETLAQQSIQSKQLIWDLPTRIFHWLLAIFIICAYACAKFPPPLFYWHAVFGVGSGLLIVWRIVWGFVGSRHARFPALFFSFGEVRDYFLSVFSGKGRYYAGHNPGSTLVIWLMILLSSVSIGTGIAAGNEAFEDLHKVAANLLVFVILAHVAGVLLASSMHQENYSWSMITGKKRADAAESITNARPLAAIVMLAFVLGGMVYVVAGLDFSSGLFRAPGTKFSFQIAEGEAEEHNENGD